MIAPIDPYTTKERAVAAAREAESNVEGAISSVRCLEGALVEAEIALARCRTALVDASAEETKALNAWLAHEAELAYDRASRRAGMVSEVIQ